MSLYRRWRPKSFGDLVGQDAVVRTLRTALSSGRLAHAYLFSGPRGSGKTSAAKILARCVDCVSGPTPDPDNTCENCLAIMAGTALDVLEIDAASNRGIDEIRALREAVKYAPVQMRKKVYILDEAHAITDQGANAFLKTLEEPPPHAIFILATTAPEKLPPTVLSRCQRYAFRRIPVATMIERMRLIADAEGISIDDAALAAIAYRADGGLRDALGLLEQVAAYAGADLVTVGTIDAAFGASGRRYARQLTDAMLARDAAECLRVIDEASDAGADMQELMRGAIAEQRNLLVARLNPELLARDLSPEDATAIRTAAAQAPQARLVRGLRLFGEALAGARFSPSPRLDLETVVLRLVAPSEDTSLEALSARVADLEESASGSGLPRAHPTTPEREPASPANEPAAQANEAAPPARGAPAGRSAAASAQSEPAGATSSAEPTLQRVRSLWQSIRTRAEGERAPLRAPLSRASVDSVEGGVVTIRLVDGSMESYVREHAAIIERAIEDALGTPLRLNVRADHGERPTQRSAHRAAARPEQGSDEEGDAELGLLDYASKTIAQNAEHK